MLFPQNPVFPFLSLQYPLLFPFVERGFHLNIPYLGIDEANAGVRNTLTMQDYYCFVCHYRLYHSNPYLCYALLSSQAVVDSRAVIDEGRLWFIIRNQNKLRSEHFQGITDVVGQVFVDGADVGKSVILPSSNTSGLFVTTVHRRGVCSIEPLRTLWQYVGLDV